MASKYLAWAFEQAPYSARDHLVLLALADSADDNGVVSNIAQWQLANKTNSTERNLRQCLDRLAREGYLSIFQRHSAADKRKQSNIYTLPMGDTGLQLMSLQQIATRENAEITPIIKMDPDKSERQRRETDKKARYLKASGSLDPMDNQATGSIDPMGSQASGSTDPVEQSPATQGIEQQPQQSDEQKTDSQRISRSDHLLTYINNKYIDLNKYVDDTAAERTTKGKIIKHSIPANWMPSEALIDRLLDKIENDRTGEKYQLDLIMALVPEFVSYWMERGEKRPGWDRSFLAKVDRSYRRLAMSRKANGAGTTHAPFNQATPNHNGVGPNYERPKPNNQANRSPAPSYKRTPTGADIHAAALERFFTDE